MKKWLLGFVLVVLAFVAVPFAFANDDQPDITFDKQGPASVDAGGTVTYVVTITNSGPGPFVGQLGFKDIVLSPLENVQAAGCILTPVPQGTSVLCVSQGTLAAGDSVAFTITATAPQQGCFEVPNTAFVQQNPDGRGTGVPEPTNTVVTQVGVCRSETPPPPPPTSPPPTSPPPTSPPPTSPPPTSPPPTNTHTPGPGPRCEAHPDLPRCQPPTHTPPPGIAFTGPRLLSIVLGLLAFVLLVAGLGVLRVAAIRRR